MVYPAFLALLPLMRTPRLPVVDLNGLFRFAERQNLVSARVPSHFKRSLPFLLCLIEHYVMKEYVSGAQWATGVCKLF
jgi:hypothetical protein